MTARDRDHKELMHWLGEVSRAALPFESRWTMMALRRVDAGLARRLGEQRGLFDEACITGETDDVVTHGAAMCRGWAAAVRAMEAAGEPDDAYLVGQCPRTGFRVAIGQQKAAAQRVVELHGEKTIWLDPNEVAALLAGLESLKFIGPAKRLWPGAEVVDLYPHEPAKAESGVAVEDAA